MILNNGIKKADINGTKIIQCSNDKKIPPNFSNKINTQFYGSSYKQEQEAM